MELPAEEAVIRNPRQIRSGLLITTVGVLGLLTSFVVSLVLTELYLRALSSGDYDSPLPTVLAVTRFLDTVSLGAIAFGSVRCRSGLGERLARALLAGSAGCFFTLTAWSLFARIEILLGVVWGYEPSGALSHLAIHILWVVLNLGGFVLLLGASWRLSRQLRQRAHWAPVLLVSVALAIFATTSLLSLLGVRSIADSHWLRRGVDILELVSLAAGFTWLFLAGRRALGQGADLEQAADSAPLGEGLDTRWSPIAGGLRLYRTGILVQIGATILGVVLVRLVASGASGADAYEAMRKLDAIKATMVFASILTFAASIVPVVGIIKYAGVPHETGARGAAEGAVFLSLVDLVLGAVSLGLVIHAARSSRLFALVDLQTEQLPIVQVLSILVGLVAVVALLRSFDQAAAHLELDDVRARARSLTVAVPIIGVCLGIIRLLATRMPVELLLISAVSGLVAGLVVLGFYIGLLGRLAAEIQFRLEP